MTEYSYVIAKGVRVERAYFVGNVEYARSCTWHRACVSIDHTHCVVCDEAYRRGEQLWNDRHAWLCNYCKRNYVDDSSARESPKPDLHALEWSQPVSDGVLFVVSRKKPVVCAFHDSEMAFAQVAGSVENVGVFDEFGTAVPSPIGAPTENLAPPLRWALIQHIENEICANRSELEELDLPMLVERFFALPQKRD